MKQKYDICGEIQIESYDKPIIQRVEIQAHFSWMRTARNSVKSEFKNGVPEEKFFFFESSTVRIQATNITSGITGMVMA
jgi:hypothetical protein